MRTNKKCAVIAVGTILFAVLGTAFVFWRRHTSHPEKMIAGKFPEQIVYVRTNDDIIDAGAIFTPLKDSTKPIAVIWIHGWGVNFYQPTYVAIGRGLADLGYTTVVANTRMHDLGNILAWRGNKRIRGGGYWGIASEQVRDVAAWVEFAHAQGFKKVILVGHSAGLCRGHAVSGREAGRPRRRFSCGFWIDISCHSTLRPRSDCPGEVA